VLSIKDFPDDLMVALKERAAEEERTLRDLVISELELLCCAEPTPDDMLLKPRKAFLALG